MNEKTFYLYLGLSGGVDCVLALCFGPVLKDIFFMGLGEIPWSVVLSGVSLLNHTLLPSETENKCKNNSLIIILYKLPIKKREYIEF